MRFHVLAISVIVLISAIVYCEYLVYYVTLYGCSWPALTPIDSSTKVTKVMILSDIHLVPKSIQHLDSYYHERQMYRSFKTAIELFSPQVIFVLGDTFNDGETASDDSFDSFVHRYQQLFFLEKNISSIKLNRNSQHIEVFTIVGNHDIGFHYTMNHKLKSRFDRALHTDSAQLIRLNGINFVTLNSVTMEGDYCELCAEAERQLSAISDQLCPDPPKCAAEKRPILLTHFPLYRESDKDCDELDSAPDSLKFIKYVEKWDCLSANASQLLMRTLRPRLVLNGHTHFGCVTHHPNGVPEWTVSSFNWRNIRTPSFLLAQLSSDSFAISKCLLPNELIVNMIYSLAIAVILLLWFSKIKRLLFKSSRRYFALKF